MLTGSSPPVRELAGEATGSGFIPGRTPVLGPAGAYPEPFDADRRRPAGSVAEYDKIHLFDVTLGGAMSRSGKSNPFAPGMRAVVADTLGGRSGLSDLLPTCGSRTFTAPTPQAGAGADVHPRRPLPAHRPRPLGGVAACPPRSQDRPFVLAAAQGGLQPTGAPTYGHGRWRSGHWAEVMADLGEGGRRCG